LYYDWKHAVFHSDYEVPYLDNYRVTTNSEDMTNEGLAKYLFVLATASLAVPAFSKVEDKRLLEIVGHEEPKVTFWLFVSNAVSIETLLIYL
jgi:hypothetical protein